MPSNNGFNKNLRHWSITLFVFIQDLTAVGITKPVHRKRLKAEIARLNIHDGIPDFRPVCTFSVVHIIKTVFSVVHSPRCWQGSPGGTDEH